MYDYWQSTVLEFHAVAKHSVKSLEVLSERLNVFLMCFWAPAKEINLLHVQRDL